MWILIHTYWPTKVLKSSKLKLLQDAILTNHIDLNHDQLSAPYFLYPLVSILIQGINKISKHALPFVIYEQVKILKDIRVAG